MWRLEIDIAPLLALSVLIIMPASARILWEYERAVVFTLGRFQKVEGPGLALLTPFVSLSATDAGRRLETTRRRPIGFARRQGLG